MTPEEQAIYDSLIQSGWTPDEAEQAVVGSRAATQPSIPSGITPAQATTASPTAWYGDLPFGLSTYPSQPEETNTRMYNYPTTSPPEGMYWKADNYGYYSPEPIPGYWENKSKQQFSSTTVSPNVQAQIDAANERARREQMSSAASEAVRLAWEREKYGGLSAEEKRRADVEQQRLEWEKERYGKISPAEQQRISIEQQQLANTQSWQQQQLAAQKEERLASLRARPSSWLEYASLSGQAPVVQPWMTGLLPQGSNLTAGQAIPGYSAGGTSMNLPELTRPSSQYQARIGPVPTQQYYGYEQARTGIPPEQTAWYLGELSAPGGRFAGMSRRR